VIVSACILIASQFLISIVSIWPVLTLAFISPIGIVLSQVGGSYAQQNHRSIQQVSISLVYFFTQVFATLLLSGVLKLGLPGKYTAMLLGAILSAAISTAILIYYRLLRVEFSGRMLKESFRFSLPLIPNSIAGWITNLSDRY
jgi:O-antigen/teichoic acid export membrane protein